MALVDYGSDSDSNSNSSLNSKSTSQTHLTSSLQSQSNSIPSNLRLPPPKRNKPTKARILLEPLCPPISLHEQETNNTTLKRTESSNSDEEGLINQSKKPKLDSSTKKKSGLAALLPQPKNPNPISKGRLNITQPVTLSSKLTIPSSTQSTHDHQTFTSEPALVSIDSSQPSNQNQSSSTPSDALNLFGLPSTSTSTLHNPQSTTHFISPPITISSAPQVAEEKPPPPTLNDPYPGYWQRSNGQWCARSLEEEEWKTFYETHYQSMSSLDDQTSSKEVPKDFFKQQIGQTNQIGKMEEFNAAKVAQTAWENKPKIIDPREEARKEQDEKAAGKPAKQVSARARGRHQLSSLLTEAQANRAELEDRISRGKFNRKAGGAKYGF
ncbi:mitotic checkpoint regulator, MAD2B-interacting-domain-containing protein [Melampsora americana]|nr:mitotic checkpoint regulator, MAD2B-interacting-domain-containing protein [Melampsora americana]